MDKNKNGIDYYYIVSKVLLEMPDKSPKEIELFLETLQDFDLLSEEGDKVKGIIFDHIYQD